MNDTTDLLQIKIEQAKRNLPEETLNAIAAVDWKGAILGIRTTKGYSFEQLGDLELETELLLCGLISPENYPIELSKRMRISPAAANELVSVMNDLVFKKIREELIKNAERKKIFVNKAVVIKSIKEPERVDTPKVNVTLAQIIKKEPLMPIQKLSGSFQMPRVHTDHSLGNITKNAGTGVGEKAAPLKVDPYREVPE